MALPEPVLMRIPVPNLLDLEDELVEHAIDVSKMSVWRNSDVYCSCGAKLFSVKAWARHASEQIALHIVRRNRSL